MKLLLIIVSLFFFFDASSQDNEVSCFIEPYVGIPQANQLKENLFTNQLDSFSFSRTGTPILLGLKIMRENSAKKTSWGIDITYQKDEYLKKYTLSSTSYYYNYPYGYYVTTTQDSTVAWTEEKIRILARFQKSLYHTKLSTIYLGVAAGFNFALGGKIRIKRSPYSYKKFLQPYTVIETFLEKYSIPVSARVYLGYQFVFYNRIGGFVEVGLISGSLLNIGTTIKI
ncbi:MAG: hypothetical protein COA33_013990 [Fluviicola sp.]|nr:hypothetical protein [Fluviicola sp.]